MIDDARLPMSNRVPQTYDIRCREPLGNTSMELLFPRAVATNKIIFDGNYETITGESNKYLLRGRVKVQLSLLAYYRQSFQF